MSRPLYVISAVGAFSAAFHWGSSGPATQQPVVADPPVLQLDSHGTSVHLVTDIRNVGTEEVSITEVRPSCGCTSHEVAADTIAPGHSAKVSLSMDLLRSDRQPDSEELKRGRMHPKILATVTTTGSSSGQYCSTKIRGRATIDLPVQFSGDQTVSFGPVRPGDSDLTTSIDLPIALLPNVVGTDINSLFPELTGEVIPSTKAADGDRVSSLLRVKLDPDAAAKNRNGAVQVFRKLTVQTYSESGPLLPISVPVSISFHDPIRVMPRLMMLGPVSGQQTVKRTLFVRADAKISELNVSLDSSEEHDEIEFDTVRVSDREFRVTGSLQAGYAGAPQRQVHVQAITADGSHMETRIPVRVYIRGEI